MGSGDVRNTRFLRLRSLFSSNFELDFLSFHTLIPIGFDFEILR